MDKSKKRDFIKISQVVGDNKVIGPLTFWQTMSIVVVFLLVYLLYSWFKISLFLLCLIGIGILGTIVMVTGGKPDRIIRRLLGKPKRWRRGFYASKPFLGKKNQK